MLLRVAAGDPALGGVIDPAWSLTELFVLRAIDGAVPDPLTQLMDVRSEYVVTEGGHTKKIRTKGRQRLVFAQEIVALARGMFDIVAWFGAMDRRVGFDYSKKAWRMVPVLRKQ